MRKDERELIRGALMRNGKARLVSCLVAGVMASGLMILFYPAEAQNTSNPADNFNAASDMVNRHVHSFVLPADQIDGLMATLGDNDTVTLQSSQAYNGDPKDGALHSHQLVMDKLQLGVIKATGTLDVESSEAAGHKHIFRFYKQPQCQMPSYTYPQPQTYPPQCCPYGGKCKYSYPYPGYCPYPGACPPPCTTCQYPFPVPVPCPSCPPYTQPTPKPCSTCAPYPAPTGSVTPGPTGTYNPVPAPTPTAAPSAGVTPVSSATPIPSCTPGIDCDCLNRPKDPRGSGIPNECGPSCETPGKACFCQIHPHDPSCPGPKAGCAATDQACNCAAFPQSIECLCYLDSTKDVCRPQDCATRSNPIEKQTCECLTNPRAAGCAEFLASQPSAPGASPTPLPSASPSVTPGPSASATPSVLPSPGTTEDCSTPGGNCYCGSHSQESVCAVSCSTPGTTCYCSYYNPRNSKCNTIFGNVCDQRPNYSLCVSPRPVPLPSVEAAGNAGGSPLPIVETSPSPTEQPGPSPTVSASPTMSPSATPSPSPSPAATPSASPQPSPQPSPTPVSVCDTPGTDCYCGIYGPDDQNCSQQCSTPGSTCYCTFIDPTDPNCLGTSRTSKKRATHPH